jgi:hypothetical protein
MKAGARRSPACFIEVPRERPFRPPGRDLRRNDRGKGGLSCASDGAAQRPLRSPRLAPPPKLLGEVELRCQGASTKHGACVGRPPPRPSPTNCVGEGEFARAPAATACAAGGPSPGPSPLVPRGEGRTLSRLTSVRSAPGAALHPSPEFGGGVDCRCEERAKRQAGERAPAGAHRRPDSRRTPASAPADAHHGSVRCLHPLPRSLWERVASPGEPGEAYCAPASATERPKRWERRRSTSSLIPLSVSKTPTPPSARASYRGRSR